MIRPLLRHPHLRPLSVAAASLLVTATFAVSALLRIAWQRDVLHKVNYTVHIVRKVEEDKTSYIIFP